MRVMLGSKYLQCRHCEESFLYSDSTIDAGLFFTMFGIVSALFTFAFDSFIIESSGVGIYEILGYVLSLMIITFGVVFLHLSR